MLYIEELAFLASASFIIGFSGAIVPGPMFVATVVWSTKRGHIAGPLVVLGHVIAETAIMLVLLLGLSFIFESNEIRLLSGVFGGLFLVWSSIDLLRSSMSADNQLLPKLEGSLPMSGDPTLAGFITSISNPYFFIWWATVGNHYTTIGLETASYIGVMVFAFAHWLSDLTWFSLVSLSASKGRKVMGDRVYRFILGVCGMLLMILGVLFIAGSTRMVFSLK
ncbi:MAG: LysE family transporter [Candidatus Bathyarchaeota archaeon]|nr:MAG: LysE family transporter [Candidatus Bathyarchaeota archaeon]